MEKRKKDFSILFKPTHACNFQCEYCHDRVNRNKVGDVQASNEVLKKTLELLEEYAENVDFIWHGGEPTVMGLDYYYNVQDDFYYRYKTKFNQSMQSNGSLINQDWIDLQRDLSIDIGVSNDILSQEIRVGKEYSLKELSELYKKNGLKLPVITVVNGENCDLMLDMLKKGEEIGLQAISMNVVYNPSTLQKTPKHLEIDPVKYGENFYKMMHYWVHNNMEISERSIKEKICLVCGSTESVTCTYGDCRHKWIGVGPTGDITFCDRDLGDKYNFGNIMDMNSIEDYHNSEAYKRFCNDIQARFDNHCSKCSYFRYCRGACNANHLSASGSLSELDTIRCECIKKSFDAAYKVLRELDIRRDDINKSAKLYLNKLEYVPLIEIKEFLASKGYNLNKLEYCDENTPECSEFKLFKLFNPDRMPAVGSKHTDYVGYNPMNTNNFIEHTKNRLDFMNSLYLEFRDDIESLIGGKTDER